MQSPQFVVGIVRTTPEPVRKSSAFQDMGSQNMNYDQPKLSKRNLKFSVNKKGLSFNAFSEHCEELRIDRHVSK